MWAKLAAIYNRAKSANSAFSLFERIWRLSATVFGPAVIAWASSTWKWYWVTYSWAGVALAFLVSLVCLSFAFFLTGLGAYWWRKGRLLNSTAPPAGCNRGEASARHHLIDIGQSSMFLDPPEYEVWKATIIPMISVNNVQVCLDFSANSGGVGYNFWRPKRRLVLRGNVDFVLGAEVPIDLLELDNSGAFWRWATNMHAGEPLVFTRHRCQLVFIAAKEPPDYFEFIVDFHEKMPSLIGEHSFLYGLEWKNDGK